MKTSQKLHQYNIFYAIYCKEWDISTLWRKTAEEMIFNGLYNNETMVSILLVSFGDVDVPYLNCHCMTTR